MILSQAMRVLGLTEQAGEAEIRKAYAQRLKATHPEDDPDGFKELREAYELALRYARYRQQYPEEFSNGSDDATVEVEAYENEDEEASALQSARDVVAPAGSALHESFGRHHRDLGQSPAPDTKGPAPDEKPVAREPTESDLHRAACNRLGGALQTGASVDELRAALEGVLTSPALANVDIYNQTESWLIHVLANTAPACYPLLDRAIEHFQWDRVGDHRNQGPGAIVALRARIPGEKVAAEFLTRVRDRRHEFHRAYKETTRSPEGRGWFSRVWSLRHDQLVDRFLAYINHRAPLAIEALDPAALDWWRTRKRGVLGWMLRAVSVARAAAFVSIIGIGVWLVGQGTGFLDNNISRAPETAQLGPGGQCQRAVERLKSAPPDSVVVAADLLCQTQLEATPDSLVLVQHAGIAALAAGRSGEAQALFNSILELSPNDPYALFGKGLAMSDPKLLGEAIKREPEVMAYFLDFPVRIPAPTPMSEEPASRWEKRPNPKFDTPARRVGEPSDKEMQELLKHFNLRRTPVGEAVLDCLVGASGGLSDCVIIKETPYNKGVGEFALRMAVMSKFEPAKLNGEAVDRVPLNYTIRLVDDVGGAGQQSLPPNAADYLEMQERAKGKGAAAASAGAAPSPASPRPRVYNEQTRRILARNDCEKMFEELRSPKPGPDMAKFIGDRMARADSFCRRELEKAPDSLVLRQHVAIVALAAGKPAEAAALFDEVLALSPNDPYALYGRGIAGYNLDGSADLSMMAEALKREPAVKAYYSRLLVSIPDVAPMEGDPKSRWRKRPAPAADTRSKQLSGMDDSEMGNLLMHFGVSNTPKGVAVLECLIRKDGTLSDCVITEEKPLNQGVGEFALRAALASTFEPARLNGEAVDRMPIVYTIRLVDPEEAEQAQGGEASKTGAPEGSEAGSAAPAPPGHASSGQ